MAHTSFFTKSPVIQAKKTPEYHFIDVGREQFHALAVALIDYFKSAPRVHDMAMNTVLEHFFIYYPHYKSNQSYLTPTEQMHRLINSSRKSELVECMAFVLRQLTVDELYTHPLLYPEVFATLNEDTTKTYLRQPHIPLPASALAAFTQALGISLTLVFKEPGKELGIKKTYPSENGTSSKSEIIIQLQGTHYFPGVKHKDEFTFVGQLAIHPPEPVMDERLQDNGSMDALFQTLAVANKEQLHHYTHWRNVLLNMVKAGELTKNQLIDLYINFLPSHTEKAHFLMQQTPPQVITGPLEGSEQQFLDLLVATMASWIGARLVDEEQLFDYKEEKLDQHSSSLNFS